MSDFPKRITLNKELIPTVGVEYIRADLLPGRELLEALKLEHYSWESELHNREVPDCPVCQLIRRAEG